MLLERRATPCQEQVPVLCGIFRITVQSDGRSLAAHGLVCMRTLGNAGMHPPCSPTCCAGTGLRRHSAGSPLGWPQLAIPPCVLRVCLIWSSSATPGLHKINPKCQSLYKPEINPKYLTSFRRLSGRSQSSLLLGSRRSTRRSSLRGDRPRKTPCPLREDPSDPARRP